MATKKKPGSKRVLTAIEKEAKALADRTLQAFQALAKKLDKLEEKDLAAAAPFVARQGALGGIQGLAAEEERAALEAAVEPVSLGVPEDGSYDSVRGVVDDVLHALTTDSEKTSSLVDYHLRERDMNAPVAARAAYIKKYGKPNRKTA